VLIALAHRVRSQGAEDVTMRVHYEAKREEIEPFLDPDSIIGALRDLISGEASGTEEEMALKAVADAVALQAKPAAGDANGGDLAAG
jgi:hypothetical protein